MIEYREFNEARIGEVKDIYRQEEWYAYLRDDEKLVRAFRQSLYLLGAFEEEKLIGFVRCVGDGEHVLLVQDMIVAPAWQKQGIGTHLLETVWERYADVRMFLVLTDIEDEVDNKFYQKAGLVKLEEKSIVGYMR